MQNNEDIIQKARKMAQTPEGRQLIGLLQQMGGSDLEKAIASAVSGDMTVIQQELSRLLKNPQAKKLLEDMEW